ncbi:hypothetical protein J5N97_003630 [Dioscorea zingiberensis]|uniref:Uncharacterized protein n=1 Tax=Dioscorea zingiberensis TaxID=325984 RepID=A0A9D5D5V0_9LILI|nr:hypothetical protein J5N97_003630 [Dioscorea zingiberensis]
MAVEMKKVIPFVRKGLSVSIRASYKFTKDHPFISGFVVFVLSLYRCFPSLFAFLVSSSPVIFCTAFLLGLLLSYGEPNIPEVDEEGKKTQEVHSLKATCAADNLVVKKDEIFAVEPHVEQRREINEDPIEATTLIEGDVNASGNVESHAFSVISHDDGERQDDALTASSSLFKEDEKEIHGEKKVDEDDYQGQVVNREFSAANSDQILFADGEDVIHAPSKGQSEFEAPQIKMDEPALGNHFASSLGSPYQHIERHDASSDSESDRAESSSPDASMADILPMLDELHPLLYSEHPQHAHKDINNSDAASQSSSDESESLDSRAEEEAENQGQEEDERQEERDDATEVAVKWTADDQKNIMDLGILELERNQRLENLIAKRRARKRLEAERNRLNLDIDDIDPVMQQLRGLHIETRPIKRNPFDLPDDSEESMGLPPIPGSAPSVLLPRWNPFDFSDDPIGETGGLTSQKMSHRKEFAPLSQREMFFRKHDSFSMEPLFSVDSTQEKRTSRFRPAESMDSDQSDYATLQRHISANSDSKVNSVPEFDSVSLVDQENKERAKQVYYDQSELLGPFDHRGEPSDLRSQSSEKLDLVDDKQEPGGINIVEDNRIGSDAAGAIEGDLPVAGAVDEEIRHNDLPMLLVSEADHLHEIKEKFNDSSSSSSSEVTDKVLDMSINEVSATVERTDSLGGSRDSTHSAILDYNNVSNKMERLDESQVANCIFYSSPSATEESLYNVAALNSELFFGGKEGSYSSSLASDLQVEISEFGSPPRRTEMNVISEGGAFVFNHRSTGEDSTSGSQDISVNFAEENDSVPREESMISEHDVIRMVYPEADTDFSDSVISMVPEPAAVQLVHRPNLSSEVNGQKDSPVDVEASLECDWNESISLTSYPEEHECLRNPTDRIDLEEFQPSVLDLPPIPEHLHESVLEQEHDSSEEPAPMVSFTGLQLFEEYNVASL